MFKNYLKTAIRNLWKRKLFTSIHIIGLGIAFGAAILLFIIASLQLTFDSFHKNKNTVHLLYLESHHADEIKTGDNMAAPLAPALKEELGGIENISRVAGGGAISRIGKNELSLSVKYVDPGFLEMFTFPLVSGNAKSLDKLENIMLTETTAEKLFGKTNPVGKLVEMNANGEWKNYFVSAIIKDFPNNSSIRFDVLTRFENSENYFQNQDRWESRFHNVFVQLKEGTTAEKFERSSYSFMKKYFANDISDLKRDGGKAGADGQLIKLKTIPLSEIHFNKIASIGSSTNIVYAWMVIVLSIFILFIASTNFINLSLAGSFNRSREIGMRKTLGASNPQIIFQLWGEAILICVFALILGGLLSYFLIDYLRTELKSPVTFSVLFDPKVFIWFFVMFLSVTAVAGGYPAWVMARFNTILTLKGTLKMTSKNRLRNGLITMQFTIAILMIISTMITTSQINYLRSKPLGYNKTQVISIPIGKEVKAESALKLMRSKLATIPDVLMVTGTDINLGRGRDGSTSASQIGFDYNGRSVSTNWLRVDYDYLKTLDIPLVAGREFSPEFSTDTLSVMINETMAKQLGAKNVIGLSLPILDNNKALTVIGVVKDYHFKSLHEEIKPLTMTIRPDWGMSYIYVKVKPANLPGSMEKVKSAWKEINPGAKAEPSFLDENTDRQYQGEKMMSVVFTSGAILTILISCMGLFAIALFIIEQRTKEIGIRKVLGANVAEIVALLSRDFAQLIIIAFIIAAPLAWWAMSKWLQTFAYRTSLHWWILPIGGMIVMLVALLTVGFQATRAALVNPVKSIKAD
jgi:putative ABC transport system permease protein